MNFASLNSQSLFDLFFLFFFFFIFEPSFNFSLFSHLQVDSLKMLLQKQKKLETVFADSGLAVYCKSGFKLVKFHDLTHHIPAILFFEDPATYSTNVGERLNGRAVRVPYHMGNKKNNEEFVSFIFFFFFQFILNTFFLPLKHH